MKFVNTLAASCLCLVALIEESEPCRYRSDFRGKVAATTAYSSEPTAMRSRTISMSSGESGMPGVFFSYELAPMMVKYTEKDRSFGHFATNVCAIIGGVFTVAGIIDSLLYHSVKAIQKKIELGKAN